jgi:hypothetical protein
LEVPHAITVLQWTPVGSFQSLTEQTHVTQLQNTTSVPVMSPYDDQSFFTSSNEESAEDLLYSDDESEYNDGDKSEYNDDDSTNRDGNIVINLPEIQKAINSIVCCKHCTESRHIGYVEEFVAFCTNERKKILEKCKSLTFREEMDVLQNDLDVSNVF